jgi:hypothetical protein
VNSASSSVNNRTFSEAVDIFRTTKAISNLKRTTTLVHGPLDAALLPRFGVLPITEIDLVRVTKLDAGREAEGDRDPRSGVVTRLGNR